MWHNELLADDWQNGAAGDWQLLALECSIRLDTAEPCLEDTVLKLERLNALSVHMG